MKEDWFISQNGSNKGPFSLTELKNMASQNLISPTDDIFDPGQATWVKAGNILGLITNQLDPKNNPASNNQTISRIKLDKNGPLPNQNSSQSNPNPTNSISKPNTFTDLKQQGFNLFTQFTTMIRAFPQEKKKFLLQCLGLLIGATFLLMLIGNSQEYGPWLLKVAFCTLAGPAIYFLITSNQLHTSSKKQVFYQISAGTGAIFGILYAGKLGAFFPTLFVAASCMLVLLSFCFYHSKQKKPAFALAGVASLVFLSTLALPQSGSIAGTFNTANLKTKIVGKWKKENPVAEVEFTSGGTLIFGKETRKYKIKSGNEIQILYNGNLEMVDETLAIDFQKDDEIIIVNSSSYGDFAQITGRFKKTPK